MEDFEYNVKRDNTVRKTRYYSVIKNPYVSYYDSKVIYGGTIEIVIRKIDKKLERWRAENEKEKALE